VPGSEIWWQILNFVISLGILTLVFAMIFKVLPDVQITWSDVWVGAAITALLFTIGKLLIGLYLGRSSVSSTYGAAGSLVVLLLWIYYSAQVLLLGAEFTQVYAARYGSRLRPDEDSVWASPEMRTKQGLKEPVRKAGPNQVEIKLARPATRQPVYNSPSGHGGWLRLVWVGVLLAGILAGAAGLWKRNGSEMNRPAG
jgi:membrane protein